MHFPMPPYTSELQYLPVDSIILMAVNVNSPVQNTIIQLLIMITVKNLYVYYELSSIIT